MLNGKIEIYRTILQINDIIDLDKYNLKSKLITPLDEYLGIDKLPFKVSLKMMIEIAFWGQNQASFQKASEIIYRVYGVKISYVTVMKITKYVGKLVYDYNRRNDYNMVIMSYEGEDVLAEDANAYRVQEEAALNHMNVRVVPSVRDTLRRPVNKLLFAAAPDYLADIEMEFKRPFVGQLSIYRSAPFYLEVMATGIDKARSMERLAKHMEIDRKQIIAFGDGYNDLTMIEYAGVGIAMGNAVDELKKKADGITASNDEDGIALALEEYFLD